MFKTTVDGIIADFEAKVQKLTKLAGDNYAEARDLKTKADDLTAEAERADVIAGKLQSLLG